MAISSLDVDVLVIGRSCVDYLYVVDSYPPEDRKIAVAEHLVEAGGQGSTAACCVARLGGRVRFIGSVGDDDAGRFCLDRLADFGVPTDLVKIIPGGRTPTAAIVIAGGGSRTIFYEPSTLPKPVVDDLLMSHAAAAPVILLDPQATYLAPMLGAAQHGLIVYDCERRREGLEDMMAAADYFIPSAEFFLTDSDGGAEIALFDRALDFRTHVTGELIVTDGPRGAAWFTGKEIITAAPPPETVKDTTRAGDNFHAAFALGLARGLPREELLAFAVAVATLSCRAYGGRRGIPSWDEALSASRRCDVRHIL
ncbi:MAG TPA: carbohydrate kinase family protein [Spirochaetota bacterium]|nr:carbohydrate kinase family protein [Spirochaetota bacterium]